MANLRRTVNQKLEKKQNRIEALPALIGDGYGNITTSVYNKVYVRIHGQKTTAVCEGIPQINDLPVWVGYEPYEPSVLRVLRVRTVSSEVDISTGIGQHAETHRYFGNGAAGGSDLLWVDHRQILPLRMYGVADDLTIAIFPGVVLIDGVPALIGTFADGEYTAETIDLSDYAVDTEDKAKVMLITIDDTGTLVVTEGSDVDISAFDFETDTPAIPSGTKWVLGAVRMYYSQTEFVEGRDNTDFMDWRFPMYHTHEGSELDLGIDDLTDVTITSVADLEILQYDSGTSEWINQTFSEADIATASDLTTHEADYDNPHQVTASDIVTPELLVDDDSNIIFDDDGDVIYEG